jgi:hypothetical protein
MRGERIEVLWCSKKEAESLARRFPGYRVVKLNPAMKGKDPSAETKGSFLDA